MKKEELVEFAESKGSCWFAPNTMQFFGTVVETDVDDNGLFITSEKDPTGQAWQGKRRYTIRKIDFETADISDFSDFGEFERFSDALEAMLSA